MKKYILALDQGTTSSRAIIFDKKSNVIAKAQKEFKQIYPKESWVEHDPIDIWSSQISVTNEVIAKAGIKASEIASIGITNQRETTVIWDRNTGLPVYNAIVWQCRRTSYICEELKKDGYENYIHENTGLVLDAYFSSTKIKWILDNIENARKKAEKGDLLFGTVDTWLIWKLTKGKVHATDYSNASRTMLYNIKTLNWDKKLMQKLNIPSSILPTVKSSSEIYGYTSLDGAEIPISGLAGDQQAALFGQHCFDEGMTKNTYGTGCFLLMNTGKKAIKSNNGLLTTIAWGLNNEITYALEGSIFMAGACIQWLRDELEIIKNSKESEELAKDTTSNLGVYFVPALVGLGAPHWDMYARGSIFGLSRGAGKKHIARAALEAIAYQVKDVINAMENDSDINLNKLKVDGGAVTNNFLMQFQADILDSEVIRPDMNENTALGAAYLAGLAVGFWKDLEDIKKSSEFKNRIFNSNMSSEDRDKFYYFWRKALERSKSWTE